MELTIISLIVMINLMIFGGATLFVMYILKSKEMEDKRIENERQFTVSNEPEPHVEWADGSDWGVAFVGYLELVG